ncbi:hypothetical protein SPIRO4BDMA_40853 [uncultured spirochete]|jgi:hypothetical protein|uniref:Uncharacterized protein n=1 Tax=uncultured spirochete TaxID=156406 RepID=A0A3P3XPQ9_9SPIR|nr:hypothetical protein SPIRO4BDMA_40853 [uncultured spirochete]
MNIIPQLPDWMTEKLGKIAATTDIWALEQESITILASEIRTFPELAEIFPKTFRTKVQHGKPRELEPLERASIIIAAYDWQAVLDLWKGSTIEEKVAAKFGALAFALRQGGEIC